MASTTPNTCTMCNGTGEVNDRLCQTCLGRSTLPVKGVWYKQFKELRERFDDLSNKVDDVFDKCNDIIEKLNE